MSTKLLLISEAPMKFDIKTSIMKLLCTPIGKYLPINQKLLVQDHKYNPVKNN